MSVWEINHWLKLVDYLPVQAHKQTKNDLQIYTGRSARFIFFWFNTYTRTNKIGIICTVLIQNIFLYLMSFIMDMNVRQQTPTLPTLETNIIDIERSFLRIRIR